jgi:hypothetical protein
MLTLSGCLWYGPVSSANSVDSLAIEIRASTSCANPGEVVSLRASVTNHGQKPQSIELADHPVLDLCVSAPNYRRCWSDGKPLTPELIRLYLKPGESKTIEMKWPAEVGTYGANVLLLTEFIRPDDPARAGVDVGARPRCPGQYLP